MYRTRNSDIGQSVKNSLTEIIPSKDPESIERRKFYHSQHSSLIKAINNIEGPIKEKHVRNLILGSCAERSLLPFWFNVLRLPLYGNQIVCWKFLYSLHKILREGFHTGVNDSIRYVGTLEDLARTWIHLRQGYAFIINKYCIYLAFKLKFHKKNQFIPPNLQIDDRDLNDLVSNDINNYFQLCCEFFDYLDEILGLQNLIFVTMDRTRSNSMIESGQCKLAPIIMLIQESNQLYDFAVKFMFKLHDNLSGDVLEGHRDRFLKIFKHLHKFYECCRNLQYFKNLIVIPELPQNPPNFRVKSDFSSYTKPVMEIKEEAPSEIDESDLLVDLNSSGEKDNSFQEQQQQQQIMYIQQLLQEIDYLRGEMERIGVEHAFESRALRDRIKNLEDNLMLSKSEIEQQKIKASNLEDKLKIMSENEKAKADIENLEKKAVSSEEKFNKMKELYNKLKDEHVALLRQEADARKQKALLSEASEHSKKMQTELEKRLEEANSEKAKLESSLKEKGDELQNLRSELELNQTDKQTANQFFENQIQQLEKEKQNIEKTLLEANTKLQDYEDKEKNLNKNLSNIEEESKKLNTNLSKNKLEIEELTKKLNESINQKNLAEQNHKQSQIKFLEYFYSSSLENNEQLIKESIRMHDDPILFNCKSGAEYLLTQLQPFELEFSNLLSTYHKYIDNKTGLSDELNGNFANLVKNLNNFSNLMSKAIVNGKITAITAGAFEQAETLSDLSKNIGLVTLKIYEKMKIYKDVKNDSDVQQLDDMIKNIKRILNDLLPKVYDINKEEIGDLIEQEMHKTSEAIEAAVAKLQSLINKSREQDSGVKLEVNDKILDNCTALMKAIRILIMKARDLQKEIVAQGRGTSSAKEFYAKNHKWTEGLVSAAKLVGLGANLLIDKTDTFVNGNGKLEEIIVCSNEIAASTAQLVVSSNVKADRESKNRMGLMEAKTNVSNATAGLVASAKSCIQIIEEKNVFDFSNMSFHQSKRVEMESQVKVLELEKQLENEKRKLYNLRKQHYKQETENN
ncbi:unnamed protein product [Brachionus calyciflorus]|uniref:Huntingtin interacting protein 1 n=1 Tax=Brachionus calyciflorus TaxID=104777 RepID=A0A813QT81_9BILA|nr:unnamed protein product [Brachionus calyciflorus]